MEIKKEEYIEKVILYSTNCPRCNVLKKKMEGKNIVFTEITNIDEIIAKGISTVPVLEVNNKQMDFIEANSWVNNQGVGV